MKREEYEQQEREEMLRIFGTSRPRVLPDVIAMRVRAHAWCPKCNESLSVQDEGADLISYAGDTHLFTCGNCGAEVSVEEAVFRQYSASLVEEGEDDLDG